MSPSDRSTAIDLNEPIITRSTRRLRELEAANAPTAVNASAAETTSAVRIDYLQRRIAELETQISREAVL